MLRTHRVVRTAGIFEGMRRREESREETEYLQRLRGRRSQRRTGSGFDVEGKGCRALSWLSVSWSRLYREARGLISIATSIVSSIYLSILSPFPPTFSCVTVTADQNTQRETGRKAQLGNITAAKVGRSGTVIISIL